MPRKLRPEEWLRAAQALPVGRSARHPHKGDRTNRPNLIVTNHPDRWTATCMSCKAWGVQKKEHVRYTPRVPAESASLTHPSDAVTLIALQPHVQAFLGAFLARKGMDPCMFGSTPLSYSERRQRLLLSTPWGVLGRDVTDQAGQKWLTYDRTAYLGHLLPDTVAVLVEDPFSYYKLTWALQGHPGYSPVCALGTAPGPRLLQHMLAAGLAGGLLCFDGDRAGAAGSEALARRLRALGLPVDVHLAPEGKDPKDLQAHELLNLVTMGGASSTHG